MQQNLNKAITVFLLILLSTTASLAHPGRTDNNGCHTGPDGYHCHGNSGDGDDGADVATVLIALGAIAIVSVGVWWYCFEKPKRESSNKLGIKSAPNGALLYYNF